MATKREKLIALKADLEALPAEPWSNIEAWAASAITFFRHAYPEHVNEFREYTATPRWMRLLGLDDAQERETNLKRANDARAKLLGWLNGIISHLPTRSSRPTRTAPRSNAPRKLRQDGRVAVPQRAQDRDQSRHSARMPIKLFISHTAADESLADELVRCLLSSLELQDNDIRCTSVPGHKLPIGCDTAKTLKGDLSDSAVVVGLLTPKAMASSWVLFELGAAWGSGKEIIPLLALGLDFGHLPGPLGGRNAVKAADETGMTQLVAEVQQVLGAPLRSHPKFQAAVKRFVDHERALREREPSAQPASKSTNTPPSPLPTVTTDADAQIILTGWFESLTPVQREAAIRFSEVDTLLHLAPGTTKRLLKELVSHQYAVRTEGEQTIMFKRHRIVRTARKSQFTGSGF